MKIKGFTMVELLAVIIIIGLLVSVSFPIVRKSINKYKTQLCERQLEEILNAAKLWGSDNLELLPRGVADNINDNSYKTLKISSNYLLVKNYIDKMKNQKTEKDMEEVIIKIEKISNSNKWKYTIEDNEFCK